MVPLIHSSGINDYEILIKKNFLKIMANIINYMSKNKIFCIYIIVKKIYRSKKKYFYSFNDNGFSVALSFQNNKNSRKFYEYLKKIIKKYDIKINLAKTDNVLVKKKVFKDKMFMSLYKNKILKNGKISRKRT